ncbi:MAG: serine/threonine-protein kinase [Deltaproteobacteria bacterium]|nr:serine/threonine-protein kinase [Deltaproteobacteria bacterium]
MTEDPSQRLAEPDAHAMVAMRRRFGRYVLRYRLASGGMAEVFLAEHLGDAGFRKWVAIKVILPHLADNTKFVQMFMYEAKLAAQIDHPNVCQVFDFGQQDHTYYLTMEYLHGQSLARVLHRSKSRGGAALPIIVRVLADAARGLHAAHELKLEDGRNAGIVHRDVSPQNIFVLYGGSTKVVDFGIARGESARPELTQTGEIKGKIAYMAPEQVLASQLDRRADIWALGVILWEALTGQRLFRRDSDAATIIAVLQERPVAPSTLRKGLPPSFDAIVAKALSHDRTQRYATALALAADLETALAQHGVSAGPEQVQSWMDSLFAAEISERNAILAKPTDPHAADTSGAYVPAENSQTQSALVYAGGGTHSETRSGPIPVRSDHLNPAPLVAGEGASPPQRVEPFSIAGSQLGHGHSQPSQGPSRSMVWAMVVGVPLLSLLAVVVVVMVVQPQVITRYLRHETAPPDTVPVSLVTLEQHPPPRTPIPTPPVPAPHDAGHAGTPIAPRPRLSPPVRPGFLTLSSTPRAGVYEGTRRLGHTPLVDFPLSPGQHRLRLLPDDGDDEQVLVLDVRSSATIVRRIRWHN